MEDLEKIAKKEDFNPFIKGEYKISKYEAFKENAKSFFSKPFQYFNEKAGNALRYIFFGKIF